MYHRVNDGIRKELSVSIKNFEWQIHYLKQKKYLVISMDTLIEKIKTKSLNDKCVVLTFDDGYADYYDNAYPILKKYGFPSINYLVSGYIESNNVFWWDQDIGKSQLMNWKQIHNLNQSDIVEFGAHTVTHPDLDKADQALAYKEVSGCKEILERKLNKKIKHFCYPRGRYNYISYNLVRELYETGVLIFNGIPVTTELKNINFSMLKRVPVQHSDGRLLFIARLKGWLVLEDVIRKIMTK